MKNLKYLSFLTIFLLFSACEEDNYEFGLITTPTNLQVNVEIVGSSSENPNGDGTGVVYFTASAENAISYEFIIDGESVAVTTSGILEHTFYTVGVNSYEVIVIASGTAGNSTSTALSVEVLATYEPPADLVEVLTGGSSKTWRVKSDVQNHFGLGPPGGLIPCEWYGAGPEEKLSLIHI